MFKNLLNSIKEEAKRIKEEYHQDYFIEYDEVEEIKRLDFNHQLIRERLEKNRKKVKV